MQLPLFSRRKFLTGATAAVTATLAAKSALASPSVRRSCYQEYMCKPATVIDFGLTPEQEARAKELHSKLVIFDAEPTVLYYNNLFDNMLYGGAKGVGGSISVDALNMRKFLGLEEDIVVGPRDWWTMDTIDENIAFLSRKSTETGKMRLCYTAKDYRDAAADGKVGIMLDTQHTYFIGNDLELLNVAKAKGIHRIQLTYNRASMAASGCMDPRDGGVTAFGREVIERINEQDMIVDVGHSSPLTLIDAAELSNKPITCSHAGMRSVAPDSPRTQPDDALRILADNGGVFGVVGVPGTLANSEYASVTDFVDQIDKAVNLMGVEHVGFALDQVVGASKREFLTAPDWPADAVESVGVGLWPWSDGFDGMQNPSGYPNLTRGLVGLGYSDDDIAKIMGGNFLRVVEEVVG